MVLKSFRSGERLCMGCFGYGREERDVKVWNRTGGVGFDALMMIGMVWCGV